MSIYSHVVLFCVLTVTLAARGSNKNIGCNSDKQIGCREAVKVDGELRGTAPQPNKTQDTGDKEKEDKKLKIGKSGSPSNADMDKVDKAMRKHSKIQSLPMPVRLCLVAFILLIPLCIIAAIVKLTPAEDLASSIYVKTALHCGFSFTVGWLNCIMLLRYRVFATMMVGNTILMGVAFICNGGFSQAKDDEGAWWMGQKAQILCPAQFENAGHYAIMILLFLVGSSIQGFLFKKFGWSSRPFAPIIAAGIIAVEVLEYSELIKDSRVDVYMLAPIFGMFVSISAHGGVGSVPWAATGSMTNMGFKLGSWCSDFNHSDLKSIFQNALLWTSFVLGIMMGTLFHSNRTVMLCALSLQGLLILNGIAFPNAAQISKSASGSSLPVEENSSGKESDTASKLPLRGQPDTAQGSRFVPRQQQSGTYSSFATST